MHGKTQVGLHKGISLKKIVNNGQLSEIEKIDRILIVMCQD
jgi:hypothetical protein